MTSTIPRTQKYWVRLYLLERDGDVCSLCKKEKPRPIDIDHQDGNPTHHSPSNLRMVCRSCNVKASIKASMREYRGMFVEREGESSSADPTTMMKMRVDYTHGSPEMQVNDLGETIFRNWVVASLLRASEGSLPRDEVVADGAELTGVSINAVRNYLLKMVSRYGPLVKFRFAGKGPTRVALKPDVREAIEEGSLTPRAVAMGATLSEVRRDP